MNTTSILLDVFLVAVVLIFTLVGKHRGFAHTLISFAGFIISILAAVFLSRIISDFVFDSMVRDMVLSQVEEALSGVPEQGMAMAVNEALNSLPNFLSDIIRTQIGDVGSILPNDIISSAQSVAVYLTDNILRPIVVNIMSTALMIIIFILGIIIFGIIANASKLIKFVPIVGSLNAFLGGIVGFAGGVIVIFVLANIMSVIAVVSGGSISFLTPYTVEGTYLLKTLISFADVSVIYDIGRDIYATIYGMTISI